MRRNPWNFKRDLKCVTYNLIFNNQSICQDFPGDAYNHTRAHPHTPAEDIWRKINRTRTVKSVISVKTNIDTIFWSLFYHCNTNFLFSKIIFVLRKLLTE